MAAAPTYSSNDEMLYCRASNPQQQQYHTFTFSSSNWNSNVPASQVPSLVTSTSAPFPTGTTTTCGTKNTDSSISTEGQISPCSFTSSEDNDPMLGYPWNRAGATAAPPSPPVYGVSEYGSCATTINSISNGNCSSSSSSSMGISATITTTTTAAAAAAASSPTVAMWPPSPKTPLDFSLSSPLSSSEKDLIGQQQQLPLSPESLYASPLLPPSSGIVSTSDILDDATSLELPSLFIMSKEPSFSSTTEYCPQVLSNSSPSSSNSSGSPVLSSSITTDEDDALKTDDMDWCFSSGEEEEDEEDQDEEGTFCCQDEDVFAHWPARLTHGISFSSSIESEYDYEEDDEEEEEEDATAIATHQHQQHPLNRLLADLREQINTKQRLKEHEWLSLYQHAKEILKHNDESDGGDLLPAIRQCVLEYVKILRDRYEPLFSIYGDQEEYIDIDDDDDDEEDEDVVIEDEDDEYKDNEEEQQVSVVARRRSRSRQSSQVTATTFTTTVNPSPSSLATATATTTIRRRKRKIEISSDEEDDGDDPWMPEEAEEEEIASSARRRQRQPSTSSSTTTTTTTMSRGSGNSRRSFTCSSSSYHRNTKKTRQNYSRETTRVLMNWYLLHGGKTPEPEHKELLAEEAKKSHVQISTWFQNARRRHHSKLVQFQKLSQAHPDQVYDYDSLLAFTEQADKPSSSSSSSSKRSTTTATDTATDDDDDDDVNYDEEAGSSSSTSSSPNKRLKTEEQTSQPL
ncbi:hypothetical protein BDB00DRAFT_878226 [Zychaea mexicana]|uniref:uncharacterized protein n=1 Tax=Zychaea mexicana TaxID=64656 RepID=UPI0022FE8DA8|nr:uncharacterized protein BDB00DRAFT_878226 [Zychaea mexicana]KAI9484968.1 hypothetical protein BDB00DRAFT_878226 [Zychaea mexicana]